MDGLVALAWTRNEFTSSMLALAELADVAGIPPAPRRKRVNLPDPEGGILPALPAVPPRWTRKLRLNCA